MIQGRTRAAGWLSIALVLAGCGREDSSTGSGNPNDAGAPAQPKGGAIVGTAKTQDGRPLDAFDVIYDGHVTGKLTGYDANGNLISGADGTVEGKAGRYEVKVPDGVYTTRAVTKVTWQGRPFTFRLDPSDGEKESKRVDVTSAAGYVRDYVWKLTGPKPGVDVKDEGYSYRTNLYGGLIELDMSVGYMPVLNQQVQGLYYSDPDAEIEYTLTPKGKLIDGSEGKTIVEKVPVKKSGTYSACLRGIPIGEYTLTANVLNPGKGARPAKVSLTGVVFAKDYMTGNVDWKDAVDIKFDVPFDGLLKENGAQPVKLFVGG